MTLREETECVETVETGWNTLAGTDPHRILEAVRGLDAIRDQPHPQLYGEFTSSDVVYERGLS